MAVSPGDDRTYVTLARIVKPRGNRGEVAAKDFCDDPDRFVEGVAYDLLYPSGERKQSTIERVWYHQGRLILKFEGVESISDAEELRGCEVRIPYEELGPPPEGEHYFVDLIGCEVIETATGRKVGEVVSIEEPGGPPLLATRSQDDAELEILIPLVPQICEEIDTDAKRIVVRLPEGLESLNAREGGQGARAGTER